MKYIRHIQPLSLLAVAIAIAQSSSSWIATAAPAAAFVSPSAARRTPIRSSSSSLFVAINPPRPDTSRFNNVIYATDDTVQLLRDELKSRLLAAADDYRRETTRRASRKSEGFAVVEEKREGGGARGGGIDDDVSDGGYAMRLLRRIVRKISRTKDGRASREKGGGGDLLSSDSFRQAKIDVGPRGERIIELAEQLSLLNPTPIPTLGFKRYGDASPSESKLAGMWKLLFTTAADATFAETDGRGVVSTSQVIDAEGGTLTNVIDFEKGKLTGLRVVVDGEPTSNTDIGLTFRSVSILRKSRFPRLFGEVSIRLPSRLIRWLASRNGVEEERGMGPYLRLRYVDDTLRMHTTDSGNWFIQTRI